MKRRGALPYQELEQMTASGFFSGFREEHLQPASVDLAIGEECYRAKGSVLPLPGVRVREFLRAATLFRHDLAQPLEPHATYLVKVAQEIRLPTQFYGFTNAKSTTGRVDIHVRLVADGVPRFDTIPRGFGGELWFLVSSGHFLVKLTPGDALSQLRVFDHDTRFDESEMQATYPQHQFLWTPKGRPLAHHDLKISDHDGSLILTLDLGTARVVGYRARAHADVVLAFNRYDHNPDDFFEVIERSVKRRLRLDRDGFYIFFTKEYLRVPPTMAAELAAVDERSGEFRSHYAGFFDPGWGYGEGGEHKGWPATLEVRPFVRDVIAVDGGPVCRVRYEWMREKPAKTYGETDSHYTFQKGPRLSKHFRSK